MSLTNNKKKFIEILLNIGLIVSILYFVIGIQNNSQQVTTIAFENPVWYGIRQILVLLLILIWGFAFLLPIKDMETIWKIIFAFPSGMVVWTIPTFFQLLFGIRIHLASCILISTIFAVAVNICTLKKINIADLADVLQDFYKKNSAIIRLFACFVFLASSGINFIFRSFDTFFFFTNYGHTLAKWGAYDGFIGEKVYVFNQVGQFLPVLNTLTSFMGLDQAFQIMVFGSYNLVVMFAYGMYRCIGQTDKNAKRYTVISTVLLVSTTSFVMGSRWVLSNVYCMIYMFVIFMTVALIEHGKTDIGVIGATYIIAISGTALALLRKDGIIIFVFMLVAFAVTNKFSRLKLVLMLLPGAIAELGWLFFVKVILGTKDISRLESYGSTTIASTKNVLLVVAVIVAGLLFVLIGKDILSFISRLVPIFGEYRVMLVALLLMIIPCIKKKEWLIFDNFDFTIRNLFGSDSAWGYSAYILFALIVLSMIPRIHLDFEHFIWIGYIILNFVAYSIIDDKVLWVNWDDSYSRILMQVVPIIMWVSLTKIWEGIIYPELQKYMTTNQAAKFSEDDDEA